MKKYRITLKPVDSYFFGGEVTFGNGTTQNYLVRSNLLPQASALLGLVRYEVLRQNHLLSYDPEDADKLDKVMKLIGNDGGFTLEDSNRTYGVIESISPLFLYHAGNDAYYTVERADSKAKMTRSSDEDKCTDSAIPASPKVISVTPDRRFICSYTPDDVVSEGTQKQSIPVMDAPEFTEKNYDYHSHWCDKDGNRLCVKGEIFSVNEQIGIKKNGKERNEENAFFKQELVTLHPDLSMAFTVNMSQDHPLEEGSRWVFLGGNRSMFLMNIESIDSEFDFREYFKPLHADGSLLALSDAFIPDANRNACSFIWGTCQPLRYMENATNKRHGWGKPTKSHVLYHLQQRGSVIYASEEELEQLKKLSYQHLGLNYFV